MKILAVLAPQSGRALEVALSLGELVVLAVAADEAVFAGLPLASAVEKYRVWDESLDSSKLHPVDFEARLAAVVAQAARRLGTSVVVLTDSQAGSLGAALAEQLNLAHVSEVLSAKLIGTSEDEALLHVRRRGLRGVQVLCGSPQAVLSVLPPMLSLEAEMSTTDETVPVVQWSLSDISLSAADLPPPQVRVVGKSERRHRPRLFIGAEALVERLRRDGLE